MHCLVEVFLRQPWRDFIQKSDSSSLSFDGGAHCEDIVFQAGRCFDLEVIQGHLGLAEPWADSKIDSKKSMWVAESIVDCAKHFFQERKHRQSLGVL